METDGLWQRCRTLFLTFLKIGAFTFGGGYAMIPLIQRETVETHHWMTDQDILDMLAIAESTPGVIAVNSATFVGYRVAGFWGALCATVGVVLPSFLVILVLSMFLAQFKALKLVEYAFVGIRSGVIVLIISAVIKLSKQCPKNAFSYTITAAAFLLAAFLKVDVILIILCAAAVGIVYQLAAFKGGDSGQ